MKNVWHILIALFVLFADTAKTQQVYFNNRYDYYNSWEGAVSILEVDSGYIVGGDVDSAQIYRAFSAMLIDKQGNEVWKKSFGQQGYVYGLAGGALISLSDGFVSSGGMEDTSGSNYALLVKFKSNGDTLWTRKYGDGLDWYSGGQCKQTTDGGFVIAGFSDKNDPNGDVVLIKTDSMGNKEWEKHYGGSNFDSGYTVDLTQDGGYIIGGKTASYGAGNNDGYVIKTDSMGNQQWQSTFGGARSDCHARVISTSGGGYMVCGCENKYFNGWSYTSAYIAKLDSLGNTDWYKEYADVSPGSDFWRIRELNDGNYAAAGVTGMDGLMRGMLVKITPQGDSLWGRIFDKVYGANYVRDFQQTNDNGFIVAGFIQPLPPDTGGQDMWVIKLDSMGCDTPGCDAVGVEEQLTIGNEQLTVRVYPNPASSTFTISGNYKLSAVLELYDLTGRQVKELQVTSSMLQVDVSSLAKGLYVWSIGTVRGKLVVE